MANLRRALINVNRILNASASSNQGTLATFSSVQVESIFRPQNGWVSRFSSEVSANSQLLDIDLSNEESKRRLFNRLLYRSKQRGFLELDLVLGKWVEENVQSMDETGIKSLISILDLENPDLWTWLTGQKQAPEDVTSNPVFTALHDKVMKNLNNHAAPEVRATPGQPWVRGWDDYKKGRDAPITGNQ